jgi:hypothetical protein
LEIKKDSSKNEMRTAGKFSKTLELSKN